MKRTPEKMTLTKSQQGGSALAPSPVMVELKGNGLGHFCEEMPASDVVSESMTWTCWFKLTRFYQVGIVYMCTRLIVNITQVFLSFYMIVTLEMSATSIAIVPLLVYLFGFVATFCLRRLNESIGRAGSFALGAGFIVLLLTLSYYLSPSTALWIYPLSSILSISKSIIFVKSVCLTGDLVGTHGESGAFVYGAMSFTEKISNGLAILFIQNTRQQWQDVPQADVAFL
ncbi:hypothetical protein PsorP6_005517 [Peronosclerospora sorghi]|uniref:Uncharacterized protein n=1 Tax=Peronosclerospora sorghi TaxID=230839 RepID=A0ACC0W4G7_9STRA|nr:hypothetical protein PsorP6_005517 [Peronosclerospora sorghi]